MRKILILGCSHSLGSYEPDKKNKEYLANKNGWWSFVDVIKKDKKYVFAGAGLGWMFWSQLIFDKIIDIKNFDFCIIQNTQPGRLSIFKKNWHRYMSVETLNNNIKWHGLYSPAEHCIVSQDTRSMETILNTFLFKPFMVENFKFIKTFKNLIHKHINRYIVKNRTNEYCKSILESPTRYLAPLTHQYWLLHMFENENIPVYVFNYQSKKIFSNAITLSVNDCLKSLSSFRTYAEGHLTIEGNKRVGNLVNKELCNYVK